MIQTQNELYKKAYVEVNAIFNVLSETEIKKLPEGLIENIRKEMNSEYKWEYDFSKSLLDQNLMVETKALLVEIYKRYLALDSEKEKWEKYDQICREYVENKKRIEYGTNNIFENNLSNSNNSFTENSNSSNSSSEKVKLVSKEESIVEHKEGSFRKILNWISLSIRSLFKK